MYWRAPHVPPASHYSQRRQLGEVSPEASLLLSPDNRDFIAGIFAGVVLAAGPLIVLALVFLNLD